MGSHEDTLREVRRISAGGMPHTIPRDRRRRVRPLTARELGWHSAPAVLALLEKVKQKACASGGEHQGNSK